MRIIRFLVLAAMALSITGVSTAGVYAQGENRSFEPSYEISLQLIVGSDGPVGRPVMPDSLKNISRHLEKNFAFRNYRLAGTFLGRIATGGSFEYKSTTNMFGQETDKLRPTFLDWSLGNLRLGAPSKGQPGYQAQTFRFGARVPITVSSLAEGGKLNPIVQYEPIGLSFNRVGLMENTPTLVGNLSLPGTEGTVFLVMTVRPADL